jgi:hypothetical protein
MLENQVIAFCHSVTHWFSSRTQSLPVSISDTEVARSGNGSAGQAG